MAQNLDLSVRQIRPQGVTFRYIRDAWQFSAAFIRRKVGGMSGWSGAWLTTGLKVIYLSIRFFALAVVKVVLITCRYLRRHPIHALLNLCFAISLAVVVLTGAELHRELVAGQISNVTVDNIIQASVYTRNYNGSEARRGSRELVGVGAPEWVQRESIRAILYHARRENFSLEDQAVLLAIAEIESGFNPMAQAPTTSACGLFQFVERTGEMFGLSPSGCMDPWLNARAEVVHYRTNFENRVKPLVDKLSGSERVFRSFELGYYLHHDGPSSSNPSSELKGIVLDGTQFLFKVYHILDEEQISEQSAPSIAGRFKQNFLRTVEVATQTLKERSTPLRDRFSWVIGRSEASAESLP